MLLGSHCFQRPPAETTRPGRQGADHQRRVPKAGGRSSRQGLGGGRPIINARPGRPGADHQRDAWEAAGRSSTQVLGVGRSIINARPGRPGADHQRKAWEAAGRSSTQGFGGGRPIIYTYICISMYRCIYIHFLGRTLPFQDFLGRTLLGQTLLGRTLMGRTLHRGYINERGRPKADRASQTYAWTSREPGDIIRERACLG